MIGYTPFGTRSVKPFLVYERGDLKDRDLGLFYAPTEKEAIELCKEQRGLSKDNSNFYAKYTR